MLLLSLLLSQHRLKLCVTAEMLNEVPSHVYPCPPATHVLALRCQVLVRKNHRLHGKSCESSPSSILHGRV